MVQPVASPCFHKFFVVLRAITGKLIDYFEPGKLTFYTKALNWHHPLSMIEGANQSS